jgi:DNA (cytosine-5)-methyltransferase 1
VFEYFPGNHVWNLAVVATLNSGGLIDDVDPAAIGLAGWSLGGYYAPRAAAFEKRLALVVAWGANHDWGAVQRRRLQREGERPVPHYWDHVLWVWGQDSIQDFIELAAQVTLDGVVERITVPFLITHGAGDRQIPLEYAHRSYDQAVNSPRRELRVFTAEEGGAEHIGLDHLPHVSTYTADWVAAAFAARALSAAGYWPSRHESGAKSRVDGAGWPMMGGVDGAELRFVSLYSGCGGLDLGFARAGMRPVWANDIDGHAVETYNKICKVTDPQWRDAALLFEGHSAVAGDVRCAARDLAPGMADVIVGGPPCQSFSVAGRMDPADPRAQHVFDFLGVVAQVRPRAFVMENVAALARNQRWAAIIARLAKTAGENYDTRLVVLNACHWGVPQARERMFLVGLPKGQGKIALPGPPTMDAPPTVGDVLRALPPLGQPGNTQLCTARITMAKAPVLRGSPYAGMLFNGQGRPVDVNRPAPTLPATMGGNRTPIIDVDQLERDATPWVVSYHHGLTAERRPPLAQLPPQARLRRLTVEEAAAIQTFPADMQWCGPQTARFRQVGNAVPPVLAWHVARAVRTALIDPAQRESAGQRRSRYQSPP